MFLDKSIDGFNEKNFKILDSIDPQSGKEDKNDDTEIFVFEVPEHSDRKEDGPYNCEENVPSSSEINKFTWKYNFKK